MMSTSSAIPAHLWAYATQSAEATQALVNPVSSLHDAASRFNAGCSAYAGSLTGALAEVADELDVYRHATEVTDARVREVADGFANADSSQITAEQLQAGYGVVWTLDDTKLEAQILGVDEQRWMRQGEFVANEMNAGPTFNMPTLTDLLENPTLLHEYGLDNPYAMAGFLNSLDSSMTRTLAGVLHGEAEAPASLGGVSLVDVRAVAARMAAAYDTGRVDRQFTETMYQDLKNSAQPAIVGGPLDVGGYLTDALARDPVAASSFIDQLGGPSARDWLQHDDGAAAVVVAANMDALAGYGPARGPWTSEELQQIVKGAVRRGQIVVLPDAAASWMMAHMPPQGSDLRDWTYYADRVKTIMDVLARPEAEQAKASAQEAQLLVNVTTSVLAAALPEVGVPVRVGAAIVPPVIPNPFDPTQAGDDAKQAIGHAAQACVVAAMLHNNEIHVKQVGAGDGPLPTGNADAIVKAILADPNSYYFVTPEGHVPISAVSSYILDTSVKPTGSNG